MKSEIIVRNLKWGLTYQVINLVLGFVTPRFIMLAYGSEINGLQNSILQIINIIALLQAGITSASVFMMYKPLTRGDFNEVSEVLQSAVMYFRKVAYIFFSLMLIAAIVFTVVIKSDLSHLDLFLSFIILGLKTTFDILFVSRYLIIFTADQNKYIISIANLSEKVIYYCLIFLIASYRMYFILMYAGLIAGTLFKIILYRYFYNKKYSTKLVVDKSCFKKRNISGKNYSMMNEISHTVVISSSMIIISAMYSLKTASVYSVYYLVISLLITIDVVIYESFSSSFGHLVADGNIDRINDVFGVFHFGFYMINTFMYMCAAFLIVPFVQIYTSGVNDADYTNYFMSLMIILLGAMFTYRIPYNICVSSYGLFKETGAQPFVCCLISIVLSIGFGCFRMELILVGPILFYFANYIYQLTKLRKLIDGLIFDYSIKQFIASILCIVASFGTSLIFKINGISIVKWIMLAIVTGIFCLVITGFVFYFVNNKRFLEVVRYSVKMAFGRERG